jgi:hypothetical protein
MSPVLISNGDNRFLQDDDLFAPRSTSGIMDPATPQLDVVLSGEVGATVSLDFRTFARIGVGVWSSGVGQVEIHDGQAIGAIAIAVGADPSLAEVELHSALHGGAFPAASQASLSNANLALSAITMPVPQAVGPVAIGVLGCLRARRRRR